MKKTIIAAAMLCVTAISAQAQDTKSSEKTNGLHFGIRAGLNLANILKTNDNNFSTQLKPGFNGGVFLEFLVQLIKYKQQKIFLVVDGHSAHKTKIVNA